MNSIETFNPHSVVPQIERDATYESVANDPMTHIEMRGDRPVAVINDDMMALAWGNPAEKVPTISQLEENRHTTNGAIKAVVPEAGK